MVKDPMTGAVNEALANLDTYRSPAAMQAAFDKIWGEMLDAKSVASALSTTTTDGVQHTQDEKSANVNVAAVAGQTVKRG